MSNNENSKLVVVQNFIDGQFEASDTYLDSLEPGNGRHSVQINEKILHKNIYITYLLEKKTNKAVIQVRQISHDNLTSHLGPVFLTA